MDKAIFWPMGALVLLTFLVLFQIPLRRYRAGFRGQVNYGDFRGGESPRVPIEVSLPNRNYMNLLELPVLFYVACLATFVTGQVASTSIWLAWGYVALRALHSAIHLTYNDVRHRGLAFAASNVVLLVLWIRFFVKL